MPPSADLLALRRGSHRALRLVGRRLDDIGAAVTLPAFRTLGPRLHARAPLAERTLVSPLALRALAGDQRAARRRSLALTPDPDVLGCAAAWLAFAAPSVT